MIHSVHYFSEDNDRITVHNFILVDFKRTYLTCTQKMKTENSHVICKREYFKLPAWSAYRPLCEDTSISLINIHDGIKDVNDDT